MKKKPAKKSVELGRSKGRARPKRHSPRVSDATHFGYLDSLESFVPVFIAVLIMVFGLNIAYRKHGPDDRMPASSVTEYDMERRDSVLRDRFHQ